MYKIIKITTEDLKKAMEFADLRCNNTRLYKKRGGFKKEDIYIGALAELAVYKLLKTYDFTISPPDFKIYKTKQKSYAADLVGERDNFHVKGQSLKSLQLYGASWLMQRTDPLFTKEDLKGEFLVPCNVDIEGKEVIIHGIFSFRSLLNRGCFGDCQIDYFNKTKIALYLDYIDSTMTNNARWSILYRK